VNSRTIIKFLLCTIGFFTGFRVLLFFLAGGYAAGTLLDHVQVFLIGLRYDLSALSYILLPLWIFHFLGSPVRTSKPVIGICNRFITGYKCAAGIFLLTVYFIDIGFHFEFNRRINYLVFDYLAYPKEIIGTIVFTFPYNLLFLIFLVFAFYLTKMMRQSNFLLMNENNPPAIWKHIARLTLGFILLVIFARGGIQQYPMHFGYSNFSDHRILNQLCLNPVWNLGRTIITAKEENSAALFDSIPVSYDESLKNVRRAYAGQSEKFFDDDFPLLRESNSVYPQKNYNVILILLESFSGQLVGSLGNDYGVSTQFDSLSNKGVLFTKMFSTGTRTNRGLSGTLLSFPPLPRNKTILRDAAADQSFSSLAAILKDRNYKTSFFYGGDLRFDNMQGFFRQQGMEAFFGEEVFPSSAHRTVYGFADEYVYDKAFDHISTIQEPFFAAILTTSNHPPYTFPGNVRSETIRYTPDAFKDERLEVFAYSDQALGSFMRECYSSGIYDNTIFVIAGDHGFLTKGDHDASIDLQMYHVPCLILAPGLDPKVISRTASHTDISPTVLHLLGGSFKHHSWGKNLLAEKQHSDFALLAPAGLNHIAGIVFEDVFYIHDFSGMHQSFTITSLKDGIHLLRRPIDHPTIQIAKQHLFSVLKSSSTALFNYTAGLPKK